MELLHSLPLRHYKKKSSKKEAKEIKEESSED